MTAVRKLYAAESRHGQHLLLAAGELRQAAEHERNAKEWLVPNAFGRVNPEAFATSGRQAGEIRRGVQWESVDCREELRGQLREIERVREDFVLLHEERVAEVLEIAAGAVSNWNFNGDGTTSTAAGRHTVRQNQR
jgi:hypothetical protein